MASIDIKITGDTKGIEEALNNLNKNLAALSEKAASSGNKLDDALGNKGAKGARQMTQEMQKATEQTSTMDKAVKNLGASFAALFAVEKVREFANAVIDTRKEFQSLEVSFSSLLGSDVKGKKLFKDITDFATSTPMLEKDLAAGAQTLLGFGIAEERVLPLLKQLGDVAMGDSQKFQSLTLAFAQATSAGKLQGQDWHQMINVGFNPLNIIAEKTGKTMGQLQDEMSKGKITAKDLADALTAATSEGGKFHGMLEAQSKTLAGSMSNLEGAIQKFENAIGQKIEQPLVDATNAAYDFFNKMAEAIEEIDTEEVIDALKTIGDIIETAAVAWGTYKAAELACVAVTRLHAAATEAMAVQMALAKTEGVALTTTQAGLAVVTSRVSFAFNKLKAALLANPYALAIAAVAALTFEIYKQIKADEKLVYSLDKVKDKAADFNDTNIKNAKTIKDLQKKWNDLGDDLDKKTEFVTKNKEELELLGIKLNDVSTAESFFLNQSDDVIKAFELRAQAAAAAALATEAYQEKLKADRDKEKAQKGRATAMDYIQAPFIALQQLSAGFFDWDSAVNQGKANRVGSANIRSTQAQEANDFYMKLKEDLIKQAEELDKKSGIATGGGSTGSGENTPTTPDKDAIKKANELAAAHQKVLDQIAANAREEQKLIKKLAEQGVDAEIEALEDGWQKEQRQREVAHQRKIEAIKQQTAEIEEQLLKQARSQWEAEEDERAKNGGETYKRTQWSSVEGQYREAVKGSATMQAANAKEAKLIASENARYANDNKAYLTSLLGEYQDYAAKRAAIEKKTNDYIAALAPRMMEAVKKGDINAVNEISRAAEEAKKQMEKALADINFEEFQNGDLMRKLFSDIGSMTDSQLQDAENSLLETIKNTSTEDVEKLKILADKLKEVRGLMFDRKSGDKAYGFFGGEMFGAIKDRKRRKETGEKETADDKRQFKIAAANYAAGQARQGAELVNKLQEQGLFGHDSKVGEKIGAAFSSAASAGEAYAKFMQGDFLGAMNSALDSVIDLFKVFGIGEGNMEELQKEIDSLTSSTADLSVAFDKLKSALDEATTQTAKEAYEKAKANAEQRQANMQQVMRDRLAQWERGSHSLQSLVNDDAKAKQALSQMGLGSVQDLTRLTPEEIQALQMQYAGGAWTTLMDALRSNNNDHNGDAEAFIADLEAYAGIKDELNDLQKTMQEKVTGVSFDEFKANFVATLQDMESSVEDFAADTEQQLNKMVLQNIADKMDGELKDLYAKFAKMAEDGITEDERAWLESERRRLAEKALQERQAALDSGLLSLEAQDAKERQGATKGFNSMSSEQANELSGRFTALQVSNQGILDSLIQGNALAASSNALLSASQNVLTSLQMLAVTRNAWLEDIAGYCKKMTANVADIMTYTKQTSEKL